MKSAYRAVSAEGWTLAEGSAEACEKAIMRRFTSLLQGTGATISKGRASWRRLGRYAQGGSNPNIERFVILRPDGSVSTRHEWTVLL